MIEPTISIEANFVNMELERAMWFSTTRNRQSCSENNRVHFPGKGLAKLRGDQLLITRPTDNYQTHTIFGESPDKRGGALLSVTIRSTFATGAISILQTLPNLL